jgi:hypothetical protein
MANTAPILPIRLKGSISAASPTVLSDYVSGTIEYPNGVNVHERLIRAQELLA